MIETMHDAKGIGLAAPQVGVVRRIAVVDGRDPDLTSEPICMVNPEIIEQSLETITSEEGCLSLPGHFAMVTRPAAVRIAYLGSRRHGPGDDRERRDRHLRPA